MLTFVQEKWVRAMRVRRRSPPPRCSRSDSSWRLATLTTWVVRVVHAFGAGMIEMLIVHGVVVIVFRGFDEERGVRGGSHNSCSRDNLYNTATHGMRTYYT